MLTHIQRMSMWVMSEQLSSSLRLYFMVILSTTHMHTAENTEAKITCRLNIQSYGHTAYRMVIPTNGNIRSRSLGMVMRPGEITSKVYTT